MNSRVQTPLNYQEFRPYPNQLNDNFVYDMDPTIIHLILVNSKVKMNY